MILVTGGTGLVGSHLLYRLAKKNVSVKALYRTEKSLVKVKNVFSYYQDNSEELFDKIQWIKGDITDIPSLENAFSEVNYVYHVAAIVAFDPKRYRAMRQVNIEGTANMVNLSIQNKVKKFCFVSSIAAIGDSINSNIVTEENEWNIEGKNNGYSITKHGAEMEVWRGSQEGIDIIIVNPGIILGGGFWKINTGTMFSKSFNGFRFYTEGVSGFIGVLDVVNSMIGLMESHLKNERYILVSENVSFREIFTKIATGFGRKSPSIKVYPLYTSILWRVEFVLSKLLNKSQTLPKDTARTLHSKTYYSSDKVKKDLGFEFTPIEKSIQETCKHYLKDFEKN